MNELKDHRFLGRMSLQKGVPPSQFVLYYHVTDLYYYPQRGLGFRDLRYTLTEHLRQLGFEIIVFYSVSGGMQFPESGMEARFRALTTEPEQGGYVEPPTGARRGEQGQNSRNREIMALNRLLRQDTEDRSALVKSAVIIERIQNLVSASPSIEERQLLDHIQSWAQILNGNVSILIADCEDLSLLPTELTGKHRSGVEIINIGLPNQMEINALLTSAWARGERLTIKDDQRVDLIHRLSNCDAMKTLDYLKEIQRRNQQLNLRTLREVMSHTKDTWRELLTDDKLDALSRELRDRVEGQDYAIDRLINIFRTVHGNVEDLANSGKTEERPLAYFFFAGPTGVGKTEIFRALSEAWKTEVHSLKVNMPEYQDQYSSSRLFGAPPGYVGHGKGELGEFLHDNPISIILFDEFEKAHHKVRLNFLTMLEGSMTTGDGVKIDLSQSIFIFTSNAGSEELLRIEPDMSDAQQENIRRKNSEVIRDAPRKPRAYDDPGAPPELIGRLLDTIIPFNNLTSANVEKIVQKRFKRVADKLRPRGWDVEFHPSVTDFMLDFSEREKASGARGVTMHIDGSLDSQIRSRLERPSIRERAKSGKVTVYKDEAGMTQIALEGEMIAATYAPVPVPTVRRLRPVVVNSGDAKGMIEAATPSIVAVLVFRRSGTNKLEYVGSGSGVILSPEGQVITNRHVAGEATNVQIQMPGTQIRYDMLIEAFSDYHDLALLRPAKQLEQPCSYLRLGNSGTVEVSQEIIALGYPHLLLFKDQTNYNLPVPARGYISAIRAPERLFLLDCSLNPGASGGAVFDLTTGELIGIIMAKHRDSEGMGYAIMSQVAHEFLQHMGIISDFIRLGA